MLQNHEIHENFRLYGIISSQTKYPIFCTNILETAPPEAPPITRDRDLVKMAESSPGAIPEEGII